MTPCLPAAQLSVKGIHAASLFSSKDALRLKPKLSIGAVIGSYSRSKGIRLLCGRRGIPDSWELYQTSSTWIEARNVFHEARLNSPAIRLSLCFWNAEKSQSIYVESRTFGGGHLSFKSLGYFLDDTTLKLERLPIKSALKPGHFYELTLDSQNRDGEESYSWVAGLRENAFSVIEQRIGSSRVLAVLLALYGDISVAQAARGLCCSEPSVLGRVAALVRKGLVKPLRKPWNGSTKIIRSSPGSFCDDVLRDILSGIESNLHDQYLWIIKLMAKDQAYRHFVAERAFKLNSAPSRIA